MLKIRQEQLDVLAQYVEEEFKQRLRAHLRVEHTLEVAAMNAEQLQQFVDRGVEKALSFKITIKRDVADYVVMLLHHGMDFEQQPEYAPALDILEDPDMAGEMKLQRLDTLFEQTRGQYG